MNTKTREISNSDDVVDSRDIIAKIEELESLRDDWQEDNELPEYLNTDNAEENNRAVELKWKDSDFEKWTEWDESSEGEELKVLLALQEQAEHCSDWTDGTTLVRDSYFEDFARQEAEDLGLIKDDIQWPYTCIDWKEAAEELQMDYTSVEWDGITYWIR